MKTIASFSFATVLLFLLCTPVAAEEKSIEQLEERIELLKKENELLEKENALLKKEIEQLSAVDKKKPFQAKAKLSDIFVVGAKFSTRSEHIVGPTKGTTGIGTMTITSRDGDSFTATNTWKLEKDGTSGTGEVKGTITSPNRARWKRVDAPSGNDVIATLRPDGAYIDTIGKNANGLVIRGVIDVSK
jgi:hypothetical protein